MKIRFVVIPVVFTLSLISGCNAIFERDLSGEGLKVLSPPDDHVTSLQTVTFWWEKTEGAIGYDLQVVSGTFNNVKAFVVDSSVVEDKALFTLQPGEYEWRVRAFNGSSTTDYITRSLTVDSAGNLQDQVLLLKHPSANVYLRNTSIAFEWNQLFGASSYQLQVAKPDFGSDLNILTDTVVPGQSFLTILPGEGKYQWRVRAMNSIEMTGYSSSVFTVDTASPASPEILAPVYDATVSPPFTMSWSRDPMQQVSPIAGDSVFIYSDSLVTLASDPFFTSGTSFTDTLWTGTFFWQVKTVDVAGNVSALSNAGKFYRQ